MENRITFHRTVLFMLVYNEFITWAGGGYTYMCMLKLIKFDGAPKPMHLSYVNFKS